jgi:hypothetical protein
MFGTTRSNVKRMREHTEMAGKMSAKIKGVNTGKEKRLLYKETAEVIKGRNFTALSLCQDDVILSLNTRNFLYTFCYSFVKTILFPVF